MTNDESPRTPEGGQALKRNWWKLSIWKTRLIWRESEAKV